MAANDITAVLLLSCPDQKGLVASVSDFLYRNDGNIIHADQHTDAQQGIFLQRVEWQLEGFKVPREGIADAFRPLAHRLYDLLARLRMGEFRAEVPLVISNHPDLRPVAAGFGAEYHHFPITPETKATVEAAIIETLEG